MKTRKVTSVVLSLASAATLISAAWIPHRTGAIAWTGLILLVVAVYANPAGKTDAKRTPSDWGAATTSSKGQEWNE